MNMQSSITTQAHPGGIGGGFGGMAEEEKGENVMNRNCETCNWWDEKEGGCIRPTTAKLVHLMGRDCWQPTTEKEEAV